MSVSILKRRQVAELEGTDSAHLDEVEEHWREDKRGRNLSANNSGTILTINETRSAFSY